MICRLESCFITSFGLKLSTAMHERVLCVLEHKLANGLLVGSYIIQASATEHQNMIMLSQVVFLGIFWNIILTNNT